MIIFLLNETLYTAFLSVAEILITLSKILQFV